MQAHPDEVIRIYERAVRLNAGQDRYHYRSSFVYRATGQVEKAKRELQIFQHLQADQDSSNVRLLGGGNLGPPPSR